MTITTEHDGLATTTDITPEQAVAFVVGLRERLIAEQAATEERTIYAPELHEELRRAGIYRMLQPKRYGGLEFDMPSFLAVVTSLARGCMSTAWAVCLGSGHALQVGAWWPESAQDEIFGDGHFVAPMTAVPGGPARRDGDGGWILETRHPYCSGAPYSTHYAGQALEVGADGGPPIRPILFIAPRESYTVLNDWGSTLGLKGSGSNSIVFDRARIPEHYVLEGKVQVAMDVTEGTPGYELHGNPIYLSPALAFFCLEMAALVVGGTQNALDEYERLMRTRTTSGRPPLIPRTEDNDYQRWFGLATARVAAAEAVVQRTAQLWMQTAERAAAGGEPFTNKDDVMLNMMAREAIKLSWEVLQDTIVRTAGSSASKNGERMERCFRDLTMAWGHVNSILQDFMARDWCADHFELR
jgi:3-hydroxy-9,10-secoandrosta-1,3,5(10)-triene-9,17-dione monooxygenase